MMRSPGWTIYRLAVLAAGASLAVYIPFKYATQLHAISGLYAFLFPLSAVLAVAGAVAGLKPDLIFQGPLWARAVLGVIGAGWLATGMLCVPSLASLTLKTPVAGLVAVAHMLLQHVVLSLGVVALALAPEATYRLFGVPVPRQAEEMARAWTSTDAQRPV